MQLLTKLSLPLILVFFVFTACQSDDPEPPKLTAKAGIDRETAVGELVTLDGTASISSDGKALAYQWQFVGKPANSKATITGADSARPSFTADTEGTFEVELTVSNGTLTQSDNVVVTVKYLPKVLTNVTIKTILIDRTTNPQLADYWVNDDIAVDAELVVMPGVVIAFAEDKAMFVNDNGILTAKGEATNRISFTGKANEKGYWRGLMFYSASNLNELSYVDVVNGGSADMISGIRANVTVDHDARLTLKNSGIAGSGGYGVNYMGDAIVMGFGNNTMSANKDAPLLLSANHVAKLDASSSFSNANGRNVVEVRSSTLTGSTEVTWPAFTDNTHYRFNDDITINTGWNLTPGITIEMAPTTYVDIGDGYIKAVGTANKRITFTGVDQTASSWDAIVVYSRSNFNMMDYVQIEYAGNTSLISGRKASVVVTSGGSLTIKNSIIGNSGGYGIFVNGGDVLINSDAQTANTFHDNADNPLLIEN